MRERLTASLAFWGWGFDILLPPVYEDARAYTNVAVCSELCKLVSEFILNVGGFDHAVNLTFRMNICIDFLNDIGLPTVRRHESSFENRTSC